MKINYKAPKLILLVGPPGSGKSTLAKQYFDQGYGYVSQDDQGKVGHMEMFNNGLVDGRDMVIDRMNFVKVQRDRYLGPAKVAGYETEIVVLHEPLETCMGRCRLRQDHPTIKDEKTARKVLNMFFTQYQRVEDNEADIVKRIWPSTPKENALIIDLDGTLCNVDHRLNTIKGEKKNWKAFFAGIKDDTPNQWCKDIIEKFRDWNAIVFCSGRPDDHQNATVEWLLQNGIKYDRLLMRSRGDFRPDNTVKEVLLDFEILTRYNPYFVIDDRDTVVKMWRSRGLTCLQCAPGEF